jgi:hypothetical protein
MIVRATHHNLCVRGSRRVPKCKMSNNRLPQWKKEAGLGLLRRQCSTDPALSPPQPPLHELDHDAHRLARI